ncbi:hypothetical protein Y032_0363g3539 [Ancylostoma ceylanicum]|uniref:Uncharacterized protein n=1 Tax=Ancylostoma ceylanicum TaxID=53326 RepID=A0A016RWC7_9BILA|nr:hypothetical protein Y032_0363g3539 [Ancylostoma ceylanicum]
MNFRVVAIFVILLSSVCASFIPYFGENQRKPRLNYNIGPTPGPILSNTEKRRRAQLLAEMNRPMTDKEKMIFGELMGIH